MILYHGSYIAIPSPNISYSRSRLDFGTWEQIFYYEFDGMRDKRVLVKIIGE